jgi:hypothetical protein
MSTYSEYGVRIYDCGYGDGYNTIPPDMPDAPGYMEGYIDGENDRLMDPEFEWDGPEDDFDYTAIDYPEYDAQYDHFERFGYPAFPNEY